MKVVDRMLALVALAWAAISAFFTVVCAAYGPLVVAALLAVNCGVAGFIGRTMWEMSNDA